MTGHLLPPTAHDFLALAEDHGYVVTTKWGKGQRTKRDKSTIAVTSVSVRCEKPDEHVVGLWINGRFSSGWMWRKGEFPRGGTLGRLKQRVIQP